MPEAGRRGFVAQPASDLLRSVEFSGVAETQLYAISGGGLVGGAYYNATANAFPFVYDIESNTFEATDSPASGNFVVASIHDAGDAIVFGLRGATENHADLRSFYPDGQTGAMTELFSPGAVEPYGYDIDGEGTMIGYYLGHDGGHGGFRAEIDL